MNNLFPLTTVNSFFQLGSIGIDFLGLVYYDTFEQ